jgi:glutathione S-transferase
MHVVDFDTALAAPGLRVIVTAGAPSPWSQAALAILRFKKLPLLRVNTRSSDPAFREWKGSGNLPAVLFDNEPVRTGWAEILALAERLVPDASLIPTNPDERVRTLGLCHELMGEGALLWCARLLAIEAGIATEGREGFPLQAARFLAPRYGHGTVPETRLHARAASALMLLDAELARLPGPYFLGDRISALDLYSAAAMNALVPLPDAVCPMAPAMRAAFEWMGKRLADAIPKSLLDHRDYVAARHIELPIEL